MTARVHPLVPPLLALVSGFVDSAAFVRMSGLFVAHVTGNFVLLGAALAGTVGGSDVTLQLAVFPCFFAAALLAARILQSDDSARTTERQITFAALAVGLSSCSETLPGVAWIAALVLVAAMATLNAAQRADIRLGPPFSVMTGNATALATYFAKPTSEGARAARGSAILLGSFTAGCLVGAQAGAAFGFTAMLAPFLALVLVRFLLWDC